MESDALRVVVVGGGIAGLSTAWYLQRSTQPGATSPAVTLLEQSERVGGKLRTDTIHLPDVPAPLVVEAGPDSFIVQKPWAQQLCLELGLEDQLIPTQPARHKVFVLHKGQPIPMPDGVMLVVPTLLRPFLASPLISWPGKLRMLLDLVLPRRRDRRDETLAGFIRRRLGAEALDKIAEPLMAGIYNAESERQSVLATFPRLRAVEEQFGSLIRGMRASRAITRSDSTLPISPFLTLKRGVGTLVTALAAQLTATVRLSTGVTALQPLAAGGYRLTLSDGSTLEADAVVLAIPASAAATLVADCSPALAAGLRAIRYVSTATVTLAYRRDELSLPLSGYGLVIPHSEGTQINACTISSRKFAGRAPSQYVLIRVFVGGSRNPQALALVDPALLTLVRDELRRWLHIAAEPVWHGIYRWNNANPQYDVGHLERIDALEALCPPDLWLTGSSYRGVGIPDCVHQGLQTAQKLLAGANALERAAVDQAAETPGGGAGPGSLAEPGGRSQTPTRGPEAAGRG